MDWQTTADAVPAGIVTEARAQALQGRAPATGAWREGDPAGDRRFVSIGDVALESGARAPPRAHRLRDVGHALARARQRDPRAARPDRRQPRHRRRPARRIRAPAGGPASSARGSRSTPTAGSWSPPTCSAAARARPARPRSRPTASSGARGSRSSPSATRCARRSRSRASSASTASRPCVGGSMGAMHVLEWAVMAPDARRAHRGAGRARRARPPTRSR